MKFPLVLAALWLSLATGVSHAAQTPEELLKQAEQLDQAGSIQQAAEQYQAFIKQYPDHAQIVEVHYRLGKCDDALGLTDEAIAQLKAVVDSEQRRFSNRADAFDALGKLYASVKNYDAAIAVYKRLLDEGAGIYEDEAVGLLGGYYAIQGKYEDAAAQFNLLRLKSDRAVAEPAAYKLALVWLKAQKMDQAIAAISDLIKQYPDNAQVPELMLKAADVYRQEKQYDKTASLCEQLKSLYPKSPEAAGAGYLQGVCLRDRKDFQKAADVLEKVANRADLQAHGLAAEAMLAAAQIYDADLNQPDKAMPRYESAAKLARNSDGERRSAILEECYFRLGEYYFALKNYGPALENYAQLRQSGSKINVLGRILACQAALNSNADPTQLTDADVKDIRAKIAANPGTSGAAEAEVFLLDRKLSDALNRRAPAAELAAEYAKLAAKYPKEVLAKDDLGAYLHMQAAACHATGQTKEEALAAVKEFEQALVFDASDANPYATTALENIAVLAERGGDKGKSIEAYRRLLAISTAKIEQHQGDATVEQKADEYMKGLLSRADSPDLIDQAIALAKKTIDQRGAISQLSRTSWFYLGELYTLRKDYSSAAKAYEQFVQIYGPKQDGNGDIAGGPWKPAAIDDKTLQVYDAAIRVAHSWYLQGHDQNMIKAYAWVVKNFPEQNRHLAEAQYWLALEVGKGDAGKKKEGQRKLADALWTRVVNPSADFDDPNQKKGYYFWVNSAADFAPQQQYVRAAILKAGQNWSEVGAHDLAAGAFAAFGAIYPDRRRERGDIDEMSCIARYALGREYAALGNVPKLIEVYKPYLSGHRGDRLRVSGLRLLGYQAMKARRNDEAMEAYATILDEYGPASSDSTGKPVPLPRAQWLGKSDHGWDGLRLAPPPDLDLGEVRFALGYMYWKADDYAPCAQALQPFLNDASLAASKSRPQALYMIAQSDYRLFDDAGGIKAVAALIHDHPHFEAIEEAYVYAARGYQQTGQWTELELTCGTFIHEWPKSDHRPRIDLLLALAHLGQGKTAEALATLQSIAKSDTFEDVKADANYALARARIEAKDFAAAMDYFDKSLAFAQAPVCLDAARCAIQLKRWERAKALLEQVRRDFPKANPQIAAQAEQLLPEVQKQLAKRPK